MKIILIVVDSLRADVLGSYGGNPATENLDSLAREGTPFSHCYASGGWTVPSVASLVTGRYPHRIGSALWRHGISADFPTIFEVCDRAGLDVCSFPFSTKWMFRNLPSAHVATSSQDTSLMLDSIKRARSDAFIYIHYWWCHAPYISKYLDHKTWKQEVELLLERLGAGGAAPKQARRRYEESILWFDREMLPRLFDAATASGQEALIAVTADHGEAWGEDQDQPAIFESIFDLHGKSLSEATCRVPLIFWGKDIPASAKPLGGLTRGVDVPITLLAQAGLKKPLNVDGVDLTASIVNQQKAPASSALTVSPHNTFEETVVPKQAQKLWRLWSVCDGSHRFTWDRLTDQRRVFAKTADGSGAVEIDPKKAPEWGWAEIKRESRRAVSAPETSAEEEAVADQLRGLGYFG